jgi:hypothetical protein
MRFKVVKSDHVLLMLVKGSNVLILAAYMCYSTSFRLSSLSPFRLSIYQFSFRIIICTVRPTSNTSVNINFNISLISQLPLHFSSSPPSSPLSVEHQIILFRINSFPNGVPTTSANYFGAVTTPSYSRLAM